MELIWNEEGKKLYRTGVDKGVLSPKATGDETRVAVAWSGLTKVTESPEGAEATPLYADNKKYLNLRSAETFKCTIEAYMYPDEFAECDGSKEIAPGLFATAQSRKTFDFAYRSQIGNDTIGDDYGYEIHFVYNATAAPSSKDHSTVNESPEATAMSWECDTTPVNCKSCKPTAHFIVDSTKTKPENLAKLEAILYGSETQEPRIPLPDEIVSILGETANDSTKDDEPTNDD